MTPTQAPTRREALQALASMLALPLSPLPLAQAARLAPQQAMNRLWRPINA
ncbi:hypothetical protein [Variovorax sp. YR750]|uniref:hypothetical protein n=1 Tax=Variovorax sp. YR750 TaxID=1884384 RepID=UPI001C434197|nr:hypothetical protein [Variovorax sp. YR750]